MNYKFFRSLLCCLDLVIIGLNVIDIFIKIIWDFDFFYEETMWGPVFKVLKFAKLF